MPLFRKHRRVILLLPAWLILLVTAAAHAAPPDAGPPYNLDRLIAQAIQNHPNIAAARARLGAAQAEVGAARSQYWPTPSVQLMQGSGESTSVLAVQQPLWAGGRLDAGLETARSQANAAQVSIAEAQYSLALRVTAAWADWVQARGRSEALDDGVALLNIYVESVDRRIEGGASGAVDRELVAARLAQTQGDLAAARSAERSALARLAQMTGQPLRSHDVAIAEAPAAEIPQSGLDALIAQAVTHSAALRRIEADIETARHETDQRRALLWPTLSLRAQHQHDISGGADDDSQVLFVLEYAPGAGLSAGANIDAAAARLLAQREALAAARRELTEQISADYEDFLASRERQLNIRRSITATAEVLSSYDRLFVAGKRNWLDVINAARELIQAQTALADVQAQQAAAHARLRLHAGEMP